MQCPNENKTWLLIETTDKLEQWLEKADNTGSELAFRIPKYILMKGDKPFVELGAMSPKMMALARCQDIIGWQHFTEGYIFLPGHEQQLPQWGRLDKIIHLHSTSCICNGYLETSPSMRPYVDVYTIKDWKTSL
jgi:hypothetical protein